MKKVGDYELYYHPKISFQRSSIDWRGELPEPELSLSLLSLAEGLYSASVSGISVVLPLRETVSVTVSPTLLFSSALLISAEVETA